MSDDDTASVTMSLVQDHLVATLPAELTSGLLARFPADLAERLNRCRCAGVVMDCSAVEVMDDADFAALVRAGRTASVMGVAAVLTGLHPGVVAALVGLGVSVDVEAALSTDDAFRRIAELRARRGAAERSGSPIVRQTDRT